MNPRILQDIGLTEGESKVYMALLELGTTTTGPIIKKSGISASKAYEILNRLTEKGFVSHIIKAKTKYFRAADPGRIIDYLDEKEKEIAGKKEEMKKIVPQLKAQLEAGGKREAEVIEGSKGVENIFWSIISELKRGEEYYVMGASYAFGKPGIVDFFRKYHAERIRRGVKVNIMFNYDTEFIIDEIKKVSEVKYMPQDIKTPMQIVVWKNKVTVILWQKNPMAFTIDNKDVAESFKIYFDALWNQETSVTKGIKALNIALDNYLNGLGPDETYNVLGATFGPDDYFFHKNEYAEAFRRVHEERSKRGVKARLLFQQRDANVIKNFLDRIYLGNNEAKILPYKTGFPVAILPSENQTLIIIHKKEPSMITINNREVSQAFQRYFDDIWQQNIRTYSGYDDFKRVWLETLQKGDVLYLIGAKGYYFDRRPIDAEEIVEAARKKSMVWKNVVDIGTKGRRITQIEFVQTRYFKEEITAPGVIWVCGGRTLITNWVKEEPIVVVIDDQDIADSYKNYFEILWGMARP